MYRVYKVYKVYRVYKVYKVFYYWLLLAITGYYWLLLAIKDFIHVLLARAIDSLTGSKNSSTSDSNNSANFSIRSVCPSGRSFLNFLRRPSLTRLRKESKAVDLERFGVGSFCLLAE